MLTAERKVERIARAKRHAAADMLTIGIYWNAGKGCSVGCDAHDINPLAGGNFHAIVAKHDGTPEWLEHLRDVIFEGLSDDKRAWWHVALAEAIPVDTDLQPHFHKIMASIVRMGLRRSDTWDASYRQQVIDAVEAIAKLHDKTGAAESAAWTTAKSAAWSTAESAAWSTAESAAWSTAENAARSAANAAWSTAGNAAAWSTAENAARSAAKSAAGSAAWSTMRITMASAVKGAMDSAAWSAVWRTAQEKAERAKPRTKWSAISSTMESGVWRTAERTTYLEIAELTIKALTE